MNILVTGGLGYIGSHTCVQLLNNGYNIIIIDDLSNSSLDIMMKINELTNKKFHCYTFNLQDINKLEKVFKRYKIDGVIHFAGLKAVNESISYPLKYYNNNIISTLNLLNIMEKYNVKKIIFSSSATVYGNSPSPLFEDSQTGVGITNPYGRCKYFIEEILKDINEGSKDWNIVILRYFNPVGCHSSGIIGENPKNIPNNLFPYILKTACGELDELSIFGSDYNTKDGTCIRDFIHVEDLAQAHLLSLKLLESHKTLIYNVGTGKGYSVLDLVKNFINTNKISFNYKYVDRRKGDLPELFANVDKIKKELNWESKKSLDDICRDGWNYCLKKS